MKTVRATRLRTLLACLASFAVTQSVCAQTPPPDATNLIEALKPKAKTRGLDLNASAADRARSDKRKQVIEVLRTKGTRGLTLTPEERNNLTEVVGDRPSVDLEIYFDHDSAAITSQAKPTLSSLGKALQAKELKGQRFLVAGHTDATGTTEYNQSLSARRAEAVKKYLSENFSVPDFELFATGFGKDQPKNASDPFAAQNRRVQVINVGE